MESVALYSPAWHALNHAVRPRLWTASGTTSEYILVCDDAITDELIETARIHCVDAVGAIDVARGNRPTENPESFPSASQA